MVILNGKLTLKINIENQHQQTNTLKLIEM